MATENDRLILSLEARQTQLEREMKRASQMTGREFRKMEKQAATAAARMGSAFKDFSIGLVAGIAGGAGGFLASARAAAQAVAQIGDEAKRAGLNVKAFQELKFVAEQNRLGVDSLVDGLKELNLRADEFVVTGKGSAAEAFARLGYDAATLSEKLRDPSALFTEIIGKLERLDRAAAIRIADEIFGGTGGEKFVQLIDRGEKGIRDQIKAANDLGIVLDREVIEKADELDRKFQAITATVGTGLKQAVVSAADALQDFLDRFRQVEARQTATLQTQLSEAERNLKSAQDRRGVGAGFLNPALDKQIEASQREVERLRMVLRDRALETIRPQLESAARGEVATKGNRLGYVPPAPDTSSTRDKNAKAARSERDAVKELISDLEFEYSLVGQSSVEREKMIALRQANVSAASAEGQRIGELVENIYREAEAWGEVERRMFEVNDLGRDVTGNLVSGLVEGRNAADVLSDALKRVGDHLLNDVLDSLFKIRDASSGNWFTNLLGGAFGGGGGFTGFEKAWTAAVPGLWSDGGYTGPGGKHQPAGIVHKGEVVWSQADVQRAGGVGAVEAMRRGQAGYANGGPVMPGAIPQIPRMPSIAPAGGGGSVSVPVNVTIDARGADREGLARVEREVAQLRSDLPGHVVKTLRGVQNGQWKL